MGSDREATSKNRYCYIRWVSKENLTTQTVFGSFFFPKSLHHARQSRYFQKATPISLSGTYLWLQNTDIYLTFCHLKSFPPVKPRVPKPRPSPLPLRASSPRPSGLPHRPARARSSHSLLHRRCFPVCGP